MKLKKLMQSFNGFNKLMIKKQLNKNTLKFTQKCVTDFFEYCKKNEIKKISDDILEKYYIDKYGKCSKSLNPKYTRPLSIAIEFAEKRDYSTTRQTYKKYHLDIEYEECLSRYFYYLQHKYKNPKSIKWVGTLFFLYLQNKSKNIRDVDFIIFKLLSGEGFSIKEMSEEFEFDYRTIKRRLAVIREAIYYVYNEEVIMVYDRSSKRYYLEIIKPHLIFINFPVK